MSTFLPPVILEIKAKATEAYKELGALQTKTKAALTAAAAEAEKAATLAEEKAAAATKRAEVLTAKAMKASGEAAVEAEAAAKAAESEALAAREAAVTARAAATTSAEAVAASSTRGAAALGTLAKVGKAAALGLSVAVAAVGYEGVKMASEYQTAITLLKTGAGESEQTLGMVSKGILAMSGQVGQSAQELAKAMYLVSSAGYHGADGLKVLQAAAEGARTDGAQLETVTDALTTVLNDLGSKAKSPADVMSKMVAAVGQGKMRMEQFAASIHSVLPNATALGLSFEQVGGALATMTAQGISAQQASQNLNHLIVKMAAPTAGMTSALASYGLSATDLAQHLGQRGLTGSLEMVYNAIFQHMGPAGLTLRSAFEQSKEAAASADAAMKAMPSTLQNVAKAYADGKLTLGGWRAQLKDLPADQAALLVQWKAMEDRAHGFSAALKSGTPAAQTFTGALKSMLGDQTSLQVALHLTGENAKKFNDSVKAISAATPEAGGHVKDWAEVSKNFSLQIAQVRAQIGAWVTTIGMHLIPVLSKGITWMQHHGTLMKWVAGIVGGVLVVAILAYAASMAAAAIAELAALWPIMLIIVAIVALVAAAIFLWTHWHQIWDWIKQHTESAWNFIKTTTMNGVRIIVDAWHAAMNWIKGILSAAWGFIKAVFHFIWEAMIPLRLGLALLVAAFRIGFSIIKLEMRIWWAIIKAIFHLFMQYVVGPVVGALRFLWETAVRGFHIIVQTLRSWWGTAKPILVAVVNAGLAPIKAAISFLGKVWSTTWSGIKSALSTAWGFIKPILDKIATAISNTIGAVDKVIGKISSAGKSASSFIDSIHVPGFATGTSYFGGGLAVVGEYGPELVRLPRGSSVYSTGMSAHLANGSAGGAGVGGPMVVEARVFLDGKEIRGSVQEHSLRYQHRNGTNGLTYSY